MARDDESRALNERLLDNLRGSLPDAPALDATVKRADFHSDYFIELSFMRDSLCWLSLNDYGVESEFDQGWFHYVELADSLRLARLMTSLGHDPSFPDEDDYHDELGDTFVVVVGRPYQELLGGGGDDDS
jgi:hypothetical protein